MLAMPPTYLKMSMKEEEVKGFETLPHSPCKACPDTEASCNILNEKEAKRMNLKQKKTKVTSKDNKREYLWKDPLFEEVITQAGKYGEYKMVAGCRGKTKTTSRPSFQQNILLDLTYRCGIDLDSKRTRSLEPS